MNKNYIMLIDKATHARKKQKLDLPEGQSLRLHPPHIVH